MSWKSIAASWYVPVRFVCLIVGFASFKLFGIDLWKYFSFTNDNSHRHLTISNEGIREGKKQPIAYKKSWNFLRNHYQRAQKFYSQIQYVMYQLKYQVCQVRAKTLEKLYVFPTFGLPTALNMPSDFIQLIKDAENLFSLQKIFMAMLLYFCFPYTTLTAKLQPIEPYKNREILKITYLRW